MEFVEKDLSYDITGAIFEVAHALGPGLLEKCYQEALEIELKSRNLKVERERRYNLTYKGVALDQEYIADFVVENKVIVELKSVRELNEIHKAQIINYLKISGLHLGILVNFNKPRIEIERILN